MRAIGYRLLHGRLSRFARRRCNVTPGLPLVSDFDMVVTNSSTKSEVISKTATLPVAVRCVSTLVRGCNRPHPARCFRARGRPSRYGQRAYQELQLSWDFRVALLPSGGLGESLPPRISLHYP